MADHLGIASLAWDDWNLVHITKHEVSPEEVEDVVFGAAVVFPSYKNRHKLVGLTRSGRVLSVVIGQVPGEPHVYHVFSARPASRKERRKFAQAQEGLLS
jgi:uncharacterized DUF497 family protein